MGSSSSSYSRNHTIVRINEDKSVTTLVPTTSYGTNGGNPKILTIKDNYLYYMLHTASEYTNQINIYSVNLETFENKKIKTLYIDYDKYKFYGSNYFNYSNVDSCIIIGSISGAQGYIVTIDFDNNYALNVVPCYGTRVYNNNYFWRDNLLYRKDLDVNKSIGGTINFINLAGNKIIINNILYNLDSDLNVGSQIKDMTTDPNYIKDSIILSVNNTNMYVMGKLDSTSYISNTANGKLCNFNEITNQFEVIYQIKAPVMQYGNYRAGCQTCFISEDGEICYVEPVVDYTAVIGYTLYGRNFYFTQPVTLQSDKVLKDYIVYNESLDTVRGSMPNNGTLNYTPSTSQQTIPLGYTSGGTIAAVDSTIDENIIADNIKKDITILGVTGTLEEGIDTSDATAIANDILEGKTAYVNGVKLTGTMENLSNTITEQENLIANLYSLVNTKTNGTSSGPYKVPDGIKFSRSTVSELPEFDTSNVTDMGLMFSGCVNLVSISNFNTSKVTNMAYMCDGCTNLTSVSDFNTSNVTNMSGMFTSCYNLVNVPNFDTSNVVRMSTMFYACTKITNIPNFDTSNVVDMNSMFYSCANLTGIPAINTSNVTGMTFMFYYCQNLISVPNFDTSNVTNMRCMFNSAYKLGDIPEFNTSNVTNIQQMFYSCNNISNTGIQNVINMCLNSNVTTYKNISNKNTYSPLYNTKFDSSYYSNRLSELTAAGWTY